MSRSVEMMRRTSGAVVLALFAGCHSGTSGGPDSGPPELTVNQPIPGAGITHPDCSWSQLGQNAAHTGAACAPAQGFTQVLAVLTFDPFIAQEVSDGKGDLYVHYQTPLVTGDDVYVETKGGSYTACADAGADSGTPCGPDAWDSQLWSEVHYQWQAGALVGLDRFDSDWQPVPPTLAGYWEPLFHAALDGDILWVPGGGGTVYRVDRHSMLSLGRVNPFGPSLDANSYVAGPLTVAPDGSLLYNAVRLSYDSGGTYDAAGVLVHISPDGTSVRAVDYSALMENPPSPSDSCLGSYLDETPRPPRPYPPADHHRVSVQCGSLRPGINVAPAVAPDGTVYTVARPHNAEHAGVLLALHADLTPKWSASLQEILDDGCGVLVPADAQPNGSLPDGGRSFRHCRQGAPLGVDPLTGQLPSGMVDDESTSSPVVLPDGAVLYGALNIYNSARGHLLKFDGSGQLVATYDDGWDQTPAVWSDGGTYGVIVKDNHYFSWYSETVGPYQITQVGPDLRKQWSFTSTNTQSCNREADGGLSCLADHPTGFEWCINAPAVDEEGTVYVNSEDGRTYALLQGGVEAQSRFLVLSLGAAYTPVTVDGEGRTYTMNGGVLTVVGK
jgi:hypothetical protein